MRCFLIAVAVFLLSGCSAIAGVFGGVSGNNATDTNDSCDRRAAPSPQPFCQEIVNTVAGTPFQQDCVSKFDASPSAGLCSRTAIVGGCEYDRVFSDGSRVTDWYYDVSQLDGGVDQYQPADRHLTADDVRAICVIPGRYEGDASFVEP
jgi:hypothetical protein